MYLILWLTIPLYSLSIVDHELRLAAPVRPGCERGDGYWDCTNVPEGIYPQ